jgi:hypothetical protein
VNNVNVPVNGIAYHVGNGPITSNEDYWKYADQDGIYINTYDGWLAGAGVSWGYHWVLSKRVSMEFTLGAGFAYLSYDKNRCTDCTTKIGEDNKLYFGPTRAGLSLIYMLK